MKKQHAAERLGLREQERDLETEHSFGRTYVVDGQRWCIGTVYLPTWPSSFRLGGGAHPPFLVWQSPPIVAHSPPKNLYLALSLVGPGQTVIHSVPLPFSALLRSRSRPNFLYTEHGRCRVTVSLGRFPCMS